MTVVTRQMLRDAAIALAPPLLFAAVIVVPPLACTPAQLTQVQDASNKRETICRFVESWAPGQPELKRLDELCKAGAQLKEIAAAYAECPAPVSEQ